MSDNILLACAHPDDQILGAGATLAKYSAEGKNVHAVIFSYGEFTQPHLKKDLVRKEKRKEARMAHKTLGGKNVQFLGIKEGSIKKEMMKESVRKKVKKVFDHLEPTEVFTHIPEDPHPDHRAVNKVIMEMAEECGCSVYGFERWSIFRFKRRDYPRRVIDVTGHLRKKIEAIKCLKSQKLVLWLMKMSAYAKAFVNSFRNDMRPAELFYKLR